MAVKIIYGDEPFFIDKEKSSIISGLQIPEMNELKSNVFDKETLLFLNTFPLFPDEKRVCYLDIDKMSSLDTSEFSEYLKNPLQSSELLILIRDYNSNTKFGKFLKSTGFLKACNKLQKEEELERVILLELNRFGARITKDALDELVRRENYFESSEVNLLSIMADLKAMCAIDKDITLPMVEKFVECHFIADKFSLAKMIKNNNIAGLIKQSQLLNKDDLIGVYSLLLREYRLAWKSSLGVKVPFFTMKGLSTTDALKGMGILQDAIDQLKSSCAEDTPTRVFISLCDI